LQTKHTKALLFLVLLFAGPVALSHASSTLSLTLEDIFSKADSIRSLSYDSKITSNAKTIKTSRVTIHGDNVYVSTMGTKIKQIQGKRYVFLNKSWVEAPGLSISTVLRFLHEAQTAKDSRIVGRDIINGDNATLIEYTQSHPGRTKVRIKIKLWISNTYFIPIKIQATNPTQNRTQTEVITNVSVK